VRRKIAWCDRLPDEKEVMCFVLHDDPKGKMTFTVIKGRDVIQFHDEYISGPGVLFKGVKLLLEKGTVIS
jgi:hypothetical protein